VGSTTDRNGCAKTADQEPETRGLPSQAFANGSLMSPLTIDFEASCLPRDGRSFPIEVGIADAAGRYRSWLIRPHADWVGWTWTREAERLHGISREQLERDGLPANVVLNELNTVIGDGKVIADSWLDAAWLDTLCTAAGFEARFAIVHLANIVNDLDLTPEQVVHADSTVAAMNFRRHRAGEDARHLALWLTALMQPQPTRAAQGSRQRATHPHL